jgi:antitoxin component YwqK of YwqJK toxin-antitoxin module
MKDDTSFGICKIWYENGQLKEESLEEWGITAKRKCWDEMGNLIEDYEISEKDNLYDLWLKQKKWWGSYSPL